jgi:hypothetical protein
MGEQDAIVGLECEVGPGACAELAGTRIVVFHVLGAVSANRHADGRESADDKNHSAASPLTTRTILGAG